MPDLWQLLYNIKYIFDINEGWWFKLILKTT